MNLRVTILKAKEKTDGSHKIRIAISHNSATRYLPTRFVVASERNLKNGLVVNMPNAAYINQQLRIQLNQIYSVYDQLEDREDYTCSQLIKIIQNKLMRGNVRTVEEIEYEMLRVKEADWAPATLRLNRDGIKRFINYAGHNFVLSMLDPATIAGYKKYLKNDGLSETTISIRMGALRRLVYFAITHGYARYDISPFFDYKEPAIKAKEITLSLDQLRRLRDMEIEDKWSACARDIFMLSFYLCGMNMGDILLQDLSLPFVKFIRAKTKSRRNPNDHTEFSIQPEARAIIGKYLQDDGTLAFYGRRTKKSIQHITDDHLRKLREYVGFDKLIFYSARKTFAQIANEMMIKDSIIEYCIGDSPGNPRKALSFYIKINKRIADKAIRKIFDAVASDKSIEQIMSEADI